MITIRKVMPDNFSVMTDHGTYSMSTVRQLVNHIEKELDINIYDSTIEEAIEEFDTKLEEIEHDTQKMREEFKELKLKLKETNHDPTRRGT